MEGAVIVERGVMARVDVVSRVGMIWRGLVRHIGPGWAGET